MKYFHPQDTRETIERFKLRSDTLNKIAKDNKKNQRQHRPEVIPQNIIERLLESKVKDRDFLKKHDYLAALAQVLGEFDAAVRETLIEAACYIQQSDMENVGLQYNYFLSTTVDDDGKRKAELPKIVELPKVFEQKKIVKEICQRQEKVMQNYAERCPVRTLRGKLDWRMVIGLGGEHIQETSMTLHHVYGIPYIPGSAVKGMVRHYFISQILEPECRSQIASFSKESFERLLKEFAENAPLLNSLFLSNNTTHECDLSTLSKAQRQQLGERLCARLEHYRLKERLDILDKILSTPNLEDFLEKKDIQQLQQEWKIVLKDSQKKEYEPRKETVQKCLDRWPNLLVGQKIFGTQSQRGVVQFFDAYPIDHVKFEIDVMNPHYPDYYNENKRISPHDSQNPNPIFFLTVADTTFTFYVAYNPPDKSQILNDSFLDNAITWLKAALQDQGIGAKSAVGYGYFKDIADQTDIFRKAIEQERQEIEEAARRQHLESLSEVDRLCAELSALKDENRGHAIFQQWGKMEGDDQKKVAAALKQHWQNIGKWSGKNVSDKQMKKVKSIKAVLGE